MVAAMPDADDQSIGRLLLYQTEDGRSRIEVRLDQGQLWLTQSAIAKLFQTTPQNITQHLRTIYADREQVESATCQSYLQVRQENGRTVRRQAKHYNLEAVLAIGYRVRSHRGAQFRQWATEWLRDYLVEGFPMDDERLKEGRSIGADYFDELLERIRCKESPATSSSRPSPWRPFRTPRSQRWDRGWG
jgi:hypothetical protein